jgi:hypothetical protein
MCDSAGGTAMSSPSEPDAKPPRDYITRWPACEVHYLILSAEGFIVFLDKDLDVDWSTTTEWNSRIGDAKELGETLIRAAAVECIPNDHQRANVRLNFKRMIGEGVARALDGDYESAKKSLDRARVYIDARNVEKARYWQLCTACTLGVIFALCGLTLWLLRDRAIRSLGDPAFFLVLASVAGSIGAVLSMIFRMGNSSPTSEAPKSLHILEAASRVLAGCFSGLLASGAVQIGLILPVVAGNGHLRSMMLVVAFVSGASERLAPSIIARVESRPAERPAKKGREQ